MPSASSLRAASRRSRACFRLTSGKTPRDSRFSLPSNRYFNRHHLPPDGETSRYSPRSSNNLRVFLPDLTFRIVVLVRLIWGQLPLTWTSVPPMLPPVAPGCQQIKLGRLGR